MKLHILCAEDDKHLRKIYGIFFDDINATYDIVEDGLEAIDKYTHSEYNIVLLDLLMPERNGIDVISHIRRKERIGEREFTPVIIMSNAENFEMQKAVMNYKPQKYILKSYLSLDQLEKLIFKFAVQKPLSHSGDSQKS